MHGAAVGRLSRRLLLIALIPLALQAGELHGPLRISSRHLGYELQYWVYLPAERGLPLPELYLTDGQAYLRQGRLVEVLEREIGEGRVAPMAAIFVDSRDPESPQTSRRNREFMCNGDYARFFVDELMPQVAANWTGADAGTRRGLMGVSFGAINSACFGQMLPGVFQVLLLHSPGSAAHLREIDRLYAASPRTASAVFLSHGGRRDNGAAAKRFARTLRHRGYPLRQLESDGGHDWDQWRPVLGDSLRSFAGLADGERLEVRTESSADGADR